MIQLHQEIDWTNSMMGTQHHYHFYVVRDLTKFCYRIFLQLKPRSWSGRLIMVDEDGNDLDVGLVLSSVRDFTQESRLSDVKKIAMEEVKSLLS